jgi:hypothetical protein
MTDDSVIYSNGIDAEQGTYGVSMSLDELYQLIVEERQAWPSDESSFIAVQSQGRERKTLGVPPSISPDNLSAAGWGVIWPPDPLTSHERELKTVMEALIKHRGQQLLGSGPRQFSYRSDWTYADFLWAEGREVEPGIMCPGIVPYYLCIVASPERVPWEFQQYLDGEYAVGRIWFDDISDAASYVNHLITDEQDDEMVAEPEALFFGTRHKDDSPTQSSADRLVEPLHKSITSAPHHTWRTSLLLGDTPTRGAYKAALLQRLRTGSGVSEQRTPSLLFTASHGLDHRPGAADQAVKQGALVCQDWRRGLVPQRDEYLAGWDIDDQVQLTGAMAFCFACYSAGTPKLQDWVQSTLLRKPAQLADVPFVAQLPQKLLAHGFLGFLGHVSRVWDFSFLGAHRAGGAHQISAIQETLIQLLAGKRVGHATDYLNERWARLTVQLDQLMSAKKEVTKEQVVTIWQARNDCRGYVLLGDPAAKLRTTYAV